MIYSRFGTPVELVRPITEPAEVEALEGRRFDSHDASRLECGMYAVGILEGTTEERLFDLGILRADDGIREINTAARAVGCKPR